MSKHTRVSITSLAAWLLAAWLLAAMPALLAQTPAQSAATVQARAAHPIPQLRKQGGAVQLLVGGKPFLMLGGELHNSSASSLEYMKPIWGRLQAMHLNTVLATVSWELLEPARGPVRLHPGRRVDRRRTPLPDEAGPSLVRKLEKRRFQLCAPLGEAGPQPVSARAEQGWG